MEAAENWASLGVVEIGAGTVIIRPGTVSSPPVTASQPPTSAGGREISLRPVALLSLFDGTGMARLGMDDMLRMAGSAGALVYSAFAEIDGVLATAVEAQWRARAACGMGVPHTQIARDVWDLVRGDAGPLRAALRAVPQGALLLLVAGSPCQDLTAAGRYRGRRGIAGPQSVLFYAVPVVARAISEIRPDLIVYVLLENAGTTLRQHRHAMGRALGMDEATTDGHSVVVDAADWAHLPRRRLLLSTFPRDAQPWVPPRRSAPWDRGWRPHWQAAMAPLMRARHQTGSFIRGSTFQYMAPRSSTTMTGHGKAWAWSRSGPASSGSCHRNSEGHGCYCTAAPVAKTNARQSGPQSGSGGSGRNTASGHPTFASGATRLPPPPPQPWGAKSRNGQRGSALGRCTMRRAITSTDMSSHTESLALSSGG